MQERITKEYIAEFIKNYETSADAQIITDILFNEDKDQEYSFIRQHDYENPVCLENSFRNSVMHIQGNKGSKDKAILIYHNFFEFLKKKGIPAKVEFPPIPVSNSFERLMYIAKYFQDPNRKTDKKTDTEMLSDIEMLSKKLWVTTRTVEKALQKLRDRDDDPLQVCGRKFTISEMKRKKGKITLESTAHPLFLTPNLTQVIVMLKGLKAISEDPQYKIYAETIAADIWKQLSDYAKNRIDLVFTKLLPEELTWYKSLENTDNYLYHSEYTCSVNHDVIIDCIKNGKRFCIWVQNDDNTDFYTDCHKCRFTSSGITFMSDKGEKTVQKESIVRSAYIPEELP